MRTPRNQWRVARRGGRRSGAALIVAMICLLLVGALSTTLVRTALMQREQVERAQWQLQAEWLAEAGLERALANQQRDAAYAGETWRPTSSPQGPVIGRVTIDVTAGGDASQGPVIRVTVDVPDDPVDRARVSRTWRVEARAPSDSSPMPADSSFAQ